MNTLSPVGRRSFWEMLLELLGASSREVRVTPTSDAGVWHWLYADQRGVAIAGPRASFTSQQSAETWLGRNVAALKLLRISAVSLIDGEHAVYGPTALALS